MNKTLLLLAAILAVVIAHSYVTSPKARRPNFNCRIGGPPQYPVDCPGPCDAPKAAKHNNWQRTTRGSALTVDWPRNNHGGGFIRLAWTKWENSDSHQAFDDGVQQVSCHETGFDGNPANLSPNRGCASDDPTNINGGDSGSSAGGERACRLRTTIPTWLSDGQWTMQWTWYAAAGGYLGDYYSCVDFNVSGGAAVAARTAPVFKGKDVTYPNENVCKFSQTDRVHYCWKEPCNDIWNSTFQFPNGRYQKGVAYLPALAAASSQTPATTAAPTSAPTSAPASTRATSTSTSRPATSQVPTTRPPTPTGNVPEIKASITVSLALPPRLVDLTVFVYELSGNLGIPSDAIPNIDIDLDVSTVSPPKTIIHFTLINLALPDGTRVDPVAAGFKLRELATNPTSSLKSTAFLSTLEVIDTEEQTASSGFVGSQGFIIMVSVLGAIVVLGAITAVVVVIVKKKRGTTFF